MTEAAHGTLVALLVHARDVDVAERERFAAHVRTAPTGLTLETCHRVEWIGHVADRDPVLDRLAAELPPGGRRIAGEGAARHVIAVGIGLDSIAIGEDQILHQLRRSVAAARAAGTIDTVVDRLFSLALRAGRRARSWRSRPVRTLADVAIAAAVERTGPLAGRPVLVVGAGEMGRLVGRAAAAAGAQVAVTSRGAARARALAAEIGAAAVSFDPGGLVGDAAAVVVALSGPWAISTETRRSLVVGSGVVVDLSVPPAIDRDGLGVRFVGIDALAGADAPPIASGESERERALVDATLDEFRAWLSGRGSREVAGALADRAELERRAELDDLWRRLPELDPAAREAIETMSRHLVRRLLRDPVERLGGDRDGRHERAIRELWTL